MRRLLLKVVGISDRVVDIGGFLAGFLLVSLMLTTSFEITTRYFRGQSTSWVLEVNEIVLVYITFLGAAWVLKREGHVALQVLVNLLKPRAKALCNMVTSVVAVIVVLVLVWYGIQTTWENYQKHLYPASVMMIPTAVSLVIIPVGSFLLFIQFVRRIYDSLKMWRALRDKIN